jgi:long-subunit acyl-CoA synthetase (AMP-forming)
MTETTCVISGAAHDSSKRGTVGKLIPNMTAKLVDGELLVKGPNVMKGYLRNPSANAATFTQDGWLRTGDICRIDGDGDIFVVDRVKEVRFGLSAPLRS